MANEVEHKVWYKHRDGELVCVVASTLGGREVQSVIGAPETKRGGDGISEAMQENERKLRAAREAELKR